MFKTKKIASALLILMLLSMISSIINVTFAAPSSTQIHIDPPSIIDVTLDPGKTFTVNATVTDVTDLYAWQVKICYNPTIINCTEAWLPPGHVFDGQTFIPTSPILEEDYVMYGATLMGAATTFSGNGTLASFRFNVTGIGSSPITFSLERTKLEDSIGSRIDFTVENGYFRNRELPPPATILVDPPRVVNVSLVPCEEFSVNVSILNAVDVYSFEFKLGFDATILSVVNAELGDSLPSGITATIETNNTAGYVWFNVSLYPTSHLIEGNATLGTITFHVESLGSTDLILYDTALADTGGEPLLYTTEDGYFNNTLLAKLAVEPEEISDPTLLPPATFQINITIADVENLCGYEFNLSYDPNILACLSLKIQDVLNETNYTPEFSADSQRGFVWVKVTYYPPAEPITTYDPAALVTLGFRVKGMGSTDLDLHDTLLTDCAGEPISHEALDGYFCSIIRGVAIVDVTAFPNEVYVGWTVTINVTVVNEGNLTETFNVTVCAFIVGNETVIGTFTGVELLPGGDTTLTLIWNTEGMQPCYNYTIKAEAGPVPYESNPANNIYINGNVKIHLLGDANGDGVVDVSDLAEMSRAYGAYLGHPRYDPMLDLNQDEIVDISDLAIAARNFGKTCKP